MIVLQIALIFLLYSLSEVTPARPNLDFYQNDYDVKMDIAECPWYNKSSIKDLRFGFVLYNRTQRVLNASWVNFQNEPRDIKIDVQVYKFTSNEYRFFPVTVSVNACYEYLRDTLYAKTIMTKLSNINPCTIRKKFYYIYNAMPDFSKFPPHIPRGQYKITAELYYKTDFLAQLDFYGAVNDKPGTWLN